MRPFKPTSGLTSKGIRRATSVAAAEALETEGRHTGLTAESMRQMAEVEASPLTTQQRKSIPKSDFVFPDKAPGPGSYPIQDRTRAANALSRSEGKPEEAAVRSKVCSRYGDLPECKEND